MVKKNKTHNIQAAQKPRLTNNAVTAPEKNLKKLLGHKQITGYLVTEGFEKLVLDDLKNILWVHEQLILCSGKPQPCAWAQDVWHDVIIRPIESIGDGMAKLKEATKPSAPRIRWALYGPAFYRRLALIAGSRGLPNKQDPWSFPPPENALKNPIGGLTLLTPNLLAFSLKTDRPFPLGIPTFVESKSGPPSRAYLKLFEALTVAQIWPEPGDQCLEIGAAPGGWTWVLAQLGAKVKTFDRAPLDTRFSQEPLVVHHQKDGFTATPATLEGADDIKWIFSDVICYPEKLYEWVMSWMATGKSINFVCTLKFQGQDHYGVIPQFATIPHSRVIHLHHNKHELTWICSTKSPYTAALDIKTPHQHHSTSGTSDSASKSSSE